VRRAPFAVRDGLGTLRRAEAVLHSTVRCAGDGD
jgi:hypothetical protein